MNARELEANLLTRCTKAAHGADTLALDQREANVFQVAASVVRTRFPRESASLLRAGELYFATHPGERLVTAQVVRNGWVVSLPRLRDMLERQLNQV